MLRTIVLIGALAITLTGCAAAANTLTRVAQQPAATAYAPAPTPHTPAAVAATPEPTPEPTATPTAPQKIIAVPAITISGRGIANSKKFNLAPGDYHVAITLKDNGYCGASLIGPSIPFGQTLVNEIVGKGETFRGETYAYDMDGGRYYVEASCGNQWSFTFSPVR